MTKKMFSFFPLLILAFSLCLTTGATGAHARDALLDGTFEGVWFQPDSSDMNLDWFVMDFDGRGNWSMPEDPSYYGSYEIDGQGRLVVLQADTGAGSVTYIGSVCPQGVLISLPDPPESPNPGISIALKRPGSPSQLQDPAGKRFNMVDFTYRRQQPEILAGFIEFDPSGETLAMYANRYSEEPDEFDGRLVDPPGNIPYTYADGRILMGETPIGTISPDGSWIIIAKQDENEPGIILMSQSDDVGTEALEGLYFRTFCSRYTHEPESRAGTVGPMAIDGAGNWQIHGGPGGIYDFLDNRGRLEIIQTNPTNLVITRHGAASPCGNVILVPDMDGGERGVSLLVSTPLPDAEDPSDPENGDPADPGDDDPNDEEPGKGGGGSSSGCFVQSLK